MDFRTKYENASAAAITFARKNIWNKLQSAHKLTYEERKALKAEYEYLIDLGGGTQCSR